MPDLLANDDRPPDGPGGGRRLRHAVVALLLLLGVALLVWVILRAGPREMLAACREAQPLPAILAAVVLPCTILVRALKWHLMFRAQGWVRSYSTSFAVYGVACTAGFLTPGRAGELSASFALRALAGSRLGHGAAVVLADRLLEGLALSTAVCVSAFLAASFPATSALRGVFTAGAAVAGGLTVLLLLALLGLPALARWLERVSARRAGGGRFLGRVTRFAGDLSVARDFLRKPRRCMVLVLLTLLAWVCEYLAAYLSTRAFVPARFVHVFVGGTMAAVAGLASAIPGGLGASNLSYAELLSLYGYAYSGLAAASLLATGIRLVGNLVQGVYGFHRLRRGLLAPAGPATDPPAPETGG